ncbi:MAG: hypothetical protein PHR77_09355 [Kiritimatiellae bacterium]|nr:hypothetical protein [Kiritimatiellia bacterium]MDD5522944.1 hypothetical protein [Kiritimatiellia bacterium]
MTDVTDQLDNPVIKGNPYCIRGAKFVVQYPLRISSNRSRTGGYALYRVSLPTEPNDTDYGPDKSMEALGYLKVGETVVVKKVYWVRHFDVGDHAEIRAEVISGRFKGMVVDLKNIQEEKLLKMVSPSIRSQ